MTTRMLDLLPAIYREDATLGKFLQAFEDLLLGPDEPPPSNASDLAVTAPAALEKQIDHLATTFDPQNTPQEFLDWLASWVALSLRADFTTDQQRDFLANTAQRYRRRGTPRNLEDLLKIFTLGTPKTIEDGQLPHRFAIEFGLQPQSRYGGALKDYPAFVGQQSSRAREVINLEKPAHTDFDLRPVFPTMRISPTTSVPNAATPGYFSTIGVDTLLGAYVLDPIAPTVTLTAAPTAVHQGETVTLTWFATNTADTSASGAWSGKQSAQGSQSFTPTAEGRASFKLTVTGVPGSAGGDTAVATAEANAFVDVGPAMPTVTITASPARVVVNTPTTLTWTTTYATDATASEAWQGAQKLSGSQTVTPTAVGAARYTLGVVGRGGNASQTAVVTVDPPAPKLTLTATPAQIVLGASTTLSWTATDTISASASGPWSGSWSGTQAANGSVTVTPSAIAPVSYPFTVSYPLTVTGPSGSSTTQTVVVTVKAPPPTATITAFPAALVLDQSAVLNWSSTNGQAWSASGGAAGWSGSKAANDTLVLRTANAGSGVGYGFTVSGLDGTQITKTATINVQANVSGAAPTVTTFTVSPSPTYVGIETTLTWATTGAHSCYVTGGPAGSGWPTVRPASGSYKFTPTATGTSTFTLTAQGMGGNKAATLTLAVNAGATPGGGGGALL